MAKRLRIPRLVPSGTRAYLRAFDNPREYGRYTADDSERLEREPWRRDGYGADYRKARQEVINKQHGRCAMCGEQVSTFDGKQWRGGEVHHKRALANGGSHQAGNLVLLCPKCHHKQDAARRRDEKRLKRDY